MTADDFWQHLDRTHCGKNTNLEPICEDHYDELVVMADQPVIWSTDLLTSEFERWFKVALKEKKERQRFPYVVRQTDNKCVVGSISYYEINENHRRCNIGYAWYDTKVWGTKVFPDCMLTLLSYGFETLALNRIAMNADVHNIRSQRAIEKLGAAREGIFRKYLIDCNNQSHDLVYYSIINDEWPKVKENLEKRLVAMSTAQGSSTPTFNQSLSNCR